MTTTATAKARRGRAPVPEVEAPASSSSAVDAITSTTAGHSAPMPLDVLRPHPANPRKDLGDLTELADSIRAHGVRQNLLVVPDPDEPGAYRLVIGHRRAAAARLADLSTVPTVVDHDLSPADQLELMLLENLQRSDLTAVEEADGYQGLLDLGVDVATIATRTGRSETTVRSRLRLVPLPEAARQAIHTHTATLDDVARLTQFEDDPQVHAALAGALGTADFDYRVKQESAARRARTAFAPHVQALVDAGATLVSDENPLPEWDDRETVAEVHVSRVDADDAVTAPYYMVNGPGLLELVPGLPAGCWFERTDFQLRVWRPLSEKELASRAKRAAAQEANRAARDERQRVADAAAQARRARFEELADVVETSGQLRADFLTTVLARKKWTAPHTLALIGYAGHRTAGTGWDLDAIYSPANTLLRYLGVDEDEVVAQAEADGLDVDDVLERTVNEALTAADPHQRLLAALAADVEPITVHAWDTATTGLWYALLERLGYVPSSTERDALAPGGV